MRQVLGKVEERLLRSSAAPVLGALLLSGLLRRLHASRGDREGIGDGADRRARTIGISDPQHHVSVQALDPTAHRLVRALVHLDQSVIRVPHVGPAVEAIAQRREAIVDLLLGEHDLAGLGVLAVLHHGEHARLHPGTLCLLRALRRLCSGEERLRLGDLRGRGLDDERFDLVTGIGPRHV